MRLMVVQVRFVNDYKTNVFWRLNMYMKNVLLLTAVCLISACGGGSGSGNIDYSSATVVEDLTTQLAAIDPNVTVASNGDGSINISNGSDTIVIKPGESSSANINFSGTLYNVQISASGAYTYTPVSSPSSASQYVNSAKSLINDLDDVSTKIGVASSTGVVDLSVGTANSSATAVPDAVTLNGTGTSTITGVAGGVTVSGSQNATQTLTMTHNLVDETVKTAQTEGWDGTGVNVTVLDKKNDWKTNYKVISTVTGTMTLSDGATTETVSLDDSGVTYLSMSHGELVEALATGSDWKAAIESALATKLDSNCSASVQTTETGSLTITSDLTYSSNYCGKIGAATGANANFKELGVDATWDTLIKEKNNSGKIEVLNFSFGSNDNNTPLNFTDNKNVVIVMAAGNDSETPNGYDIFGDGKNIEGSTEPLENIEIALLESSFADNLIAVGALDANDNIANYSTIAGSSYDGSSYAFIVDDGTVSMVINTTTKTNGSLNMTYQGSTVAGTFDATLTDELTVSTFGTSYAAPRVTGKIAITSQKFPNLNAEQLVNLAKHTAIDLGDKGVDQIYGHGKINLTGMLSPIGRLK